jgi:hypothetical protein
VYSGARLSLAQDAPAEDEACYQAWVKGKEQGIGRPGSYLDYLLLSFACALYKLDSIIIIQWHPGFPHIQPEVPRG